MQSANHVELICIQLALAGGLILGLEKLQEILGVVTADHSERSRHVDDDKTRGTKSQIIVTKPETRKYQDEDIRCIDDYGTQKHSYEFWDKGKTTDSRTNDSEIKNNLENKIGGRVQNEW